MHRRRNRLAQLLESENIIYRRELENSVESFAERRARMIETVRMCYVWRYCAQAKAHIAKRIQAKELQKKREIARQEEVQRIRAEQFKDGLDEFRVLKSKAIKMQCHGGREEQIAAREARAKVEVCCRVIVRRLIPMHHLLAKSDAKLLSYLT